MASTSQTGDRNDGPGDYYRRKQKEADDAQFELSYHELVECKGEYFCSRCSTLKAKLELARYVGD